MNFCKRCGSSNLTTGGQCINCENSNQLIFNTETKCPFKCPVCNGTGLVSRPPGIAGDVEVWADFGTGPYQCRVCNGSGVLWR